MHSMTKDCKREEELSTKKVKRNFKCAQITFSNQLLQRTWYILQTQVGSPAVRLRLARCMAWVKRWSKAMDYKYLLIEHL